LPLHTTLLTTSVTFTDTPSKSTTLTATTTTATTPTLSSNTVSNNALAEDCGVDGRCNGGGNCGRGKCLVQRGVHKRRAGWLSIVGQLHVGAWSGVRALVIHTTHHCWPAAARDRRARRLRRAIASSRDRVVVIVVGAVSRSTASRISRAI
jgi:hypothetical protein